MHTVCGGMLHTAIFRFLDFNVTIGCARNYFETGCSKECLEDALTYNCTNHGEPKCRAGYFPEKEDLKACLHEPESYCSVRCQPYGYKSNMECDECGVLRCTDEGASNVTYF